MNFFFLFLRQKSYISSQQYKNLSVSSENHYPAFKSSPSTTHCCCNQLYYGTRGRLVPASNNFQQVYTSQVLGNLSSFSHIQIQPKQVVGTSVKQSDNPGKMAVQPFSINIPIVAPATLEGVPAPDTQSQTVFLQGSADQSKVPSSPSNVLS